MPGESSAFAEASVSVDLSKTLQIKRGAKLRHEHFKDCFARQRAATCLEILEAIGDPAMLLIPTVCSRMQS